MSPTKIRQALAGLGMLAMLLPVLPAHAATITYSNGSAAMSFTDNNCTTGFALSGNTLSCQSGGGGVAVPTGCVPALGTTPATLTSAGGTANLSVSGCSTATGYSWTRNGNVFSTQQNPTDTLAANTSTTTPQTTSYQVTVCNGTSCTTPLPATPLTATVPVAASTPPPPPPPSGSLSCSGYANTIVVDWAWTPKTQQLKDVPAPFGDDDIVVVRFTTPANLANYGAYGFIGWGDSVANNKRTVALTTSACEVNLAYPAGQVGPAGNIAFNGFPGAGVALKPSTTYYFNINNRNNGVPTCGGSHCPISVTLKTN